MRVVVADPSEMIRRMLRRAFARDPSIELVGETQCGAQALELVAELHADALVTEVDLATIDGVEVTRRLRASHPSLRVIAYSSDGSAEPATRAAGADAFLMKRDARSLLELLHRLDPDVR